MARPVSKHPTELELEILKVLWNRGPSSVREVREALAASRKLAHTSVMTVLGIMAEKGQVDREKEGGHFVYRSRIRKETTLRRMMTDVVDRAYDGAVGVAVLQLVESSKLSAEELKELRGLLRDKLEGDES